MALMVSWIFKFFIRIQEKSYFILELPIYRAPRWKNVLVTMINKAKIFVTDAGKVIMVISVLLWFLSSYGPSQRSEQLKKEYTIALQSATTDTAKAHVEKQYQANKLANSYAGLMGQKISPVIEPLGYDWKIGIALITSFAAREVFVGTMATLYSVESDDENSLKDKMRAAVKQDGTPVYTLATAFSLLVFYVLAMQCMSTLAIVKRETGTWKWPAIQFFMMTGLAYVLSWLTYSLLQ
jgi:ferrous iron transport protein B